MKIKDIAILPPLAFARFGSSKTPVDNYTLGPPPDDNPLGYRSIKPQPTFVVGKNGEITRKDEDQVAEISFKEKIEEPDGTVVHHVRPVAPFFELWAEFEDESFGPLTKDLLGDAKLEWCVELANRKVYRRTRKTDDIVKNTVKDDEWISDHEVHEIRGNSPNFIGDCHIETIPPSLFAILPPAPPWLNRDIAISRGYLDDACDGFVRARLTIGDKILKAKARIGVAPPHYAPDSLFVRNLVDDLEQALEGVNLSGDSRERALDVVRRAFETVRFMNVAVMNGNPFKGRDPLELDTMPAEEAFGTERPLRAVFSPPAADTRAIAALHQRAYAALTSGSAGWFTKLLRRPEEIADLTDSGRRKMPALMSGAESYYLALTRRQISAIEKIGALGSAPPPLRPTTKDDLVRLRPRNHTAELMYKAAGNPISSHPITAISNCCPGLEFDFRAVWRRLLVGITLVEHDNLVAETDKEPKELKDLRGRRLLTIDGRSVITKIVGPKPSDPTTPMVLIKEDNPDGVVCMEWSNNFAEADPGEFIQGLCSPWQNDFRECSCYYWASSRPDYVNVTTGGEGMSRGDNWMQKKRTRDYIADDYQNRELIIYDDLFVAWEKLLKFEVGGKDYGIDAEPEEAGSTPPCDQS